MVHLSAGQDICLVHMEHNNTEIADKRRTATWTGQFSYEVTIGVPSLFKDMVAWEKCKLIFILQMDYFLLLLHLSFWSLWFFLLMVLWAHITTEFSIWFFRKTEATHQPRLMKYIIHPYWSFQVSLWNRFLITACWSLLGFWTTHTCLEWTEMSFSAFSRDYFHPLMQIITLLLSFKEKNQLTSNENLAQISWKTSGNSDLFCLAITKDSIIGASSIRCKHTTKS